MIRNKKFNKSRPPRAKKRKVSEVSNPLTSTVVSALPIGMDTISPNSLKAPLFQVPAQLISNNNAMAHVRNENDAVNNSVSQTTSKKKAIRFTVGIIAIAILGAGGFFFARNKEGIFAKNSLEKTINPIESVTQTEKETIDSLVAQISKIMLLPEGETPVVAEVKDLEKLKEDQFFVNAKLGNKVLIYQEAHRVILFDPVSQRVINVGNLATNDYPNSTKSDDEKPKVEDNKKKE